MLTIKVELNSAITGKTTTIAKMIIANEGRVFGRPDLSNYWGEATHDGYGNDPGAFEVRGVVESYARSDLPIWALISRMLNNMGYK